MSNIIDQNQIKRGGDDRPARTSRRQLMVAALTTPMIIATSAQAARAKEKYGKGNGPAAASVPASTGN